MSNIVTDLVETVVIAGAKFVAQKLISSAMPSSSSSVSSTLTGPVDLFGDMEVEEIVKASGDYVRNVSTRPLKKKRTESNALFTQTGLSILSQSGKNRIPRLLMSYGKRVHPDLIGPFLKNLSGRGVVNNEWNGIIRSALNIRTTFLTFFRHNMSFYASGVGFVEQGPYDDSIAVNIMTPKQATSIPIAGTNGSVQSSAVVHTDQEAYFAPINRSDYEDMSWNLNKLKLQPHGAQAGVPFFSDNVPLLQVNRHRRVSSLHINNALPSTNTGVIQESPYKYNMVFSYGEISYVFSNKGAFASTVEIILYRIKKNSSVISNDPSGGIESKMYPSYVYDQLTAAISVGYMDTIRDKFGTEDLGGRTPQEQDIVINPRFPLLPKLKKTLQSNLPFSEVLRKSFVLPSGARRPVDIQLPGSVYDPTNIRTNQGANLPIPSSTTGLRESGFYPQLDEHCYAVLIAVNGVIQTRNFHKPSHLDGTILNKPVAPVDVPFLDVYGPSDVQYYCSYSEHIGSCQYKDPGTKRIYVRGASMYPKFSGDTDVAEEAVILIPADHAIRTPRRDINFTTSTLAANGQAFTTTATKGTDTGTGIAAAAGA